MKVCSLSSCHTGMSLGERAPQKHYEMYGFCTLLFSPLYLFALSNLSFCRLLGLEMSVSLAYRDITGKLKVVHSVGHSNFFIQLPHLSQFLPT